ncbi:LOW QUALITY PROTEIN: putative DNA (cytosine-5)-methyltransferase CMT1 [Rutidosis leptorrhynchoides]|uniref:LOW QUALITY PROTEIN: putative DNA (cytosine-5)-methyltransferase CMT1 n=1 Tax=Rutidosis leptorrhynchoides TaxID=125765 RepID=UPI003A995139
MAKSRKQKAGKDDLPDNRRRSKKAKIAEPEELSEEQLDLFDEEDDIADPDNTTLASSQIKRTQLVNPESDDASLIGNPFLGTEARERWPLRYLSKKQKKVVVAAKNPGEADVEVLQAKCHYSQAMVDGIHYKLGDDAYVQADKGKPNYIGKIVELFETLDNEPYFEAQWFYRAEDTLITDVIGLSESRRVFISDMKDDNHLGCLVSKLKIAQVQPSLDLDAKVKALPLCDLYYDMKFTLPFCTFKACTQVAHIASTPNNSSGDSADDSAISTDSGSNRPVVANNPARVETDEINESKKSEVLLLDLYSGCGTMSTGLCIGAALSGVKLVTRWAVDTNFHACKSLEMNHPETEVRNEAAEDFLSLLKEWEILCHKFGLIVSDKLPEHIVSDNEDESEDDEDSEDGDKSKDAEVFEVGRILAICFGDPNKVKEPGLYFKVRWLGYGPSDDTWEPIEGLSNCKEKIKEFVTKGFKSKILPLPGTVDFICGGPPCQGISGFNRFRKKESPLEGDKNRQLIIFLNIIEYLKPQYVLMENVVDILRFSKGHLTRYAVGRLVSMNYQTRLGKIAAGSYGLPQFRMRVFLWAANPTRKLPPYPLPTHKVDGKGLGASEFEEISVTSNNLPCELENALYLGDAISDLPIASNDEDRDERKYGEKFKTEFQKYIRLKRSDIISFETSTKPQMLYDHRPLKLNEDDYERVCNVPKRKGANFRDLPDVLVSPDDGKVYLDPSKERCLVKSGKPMVPEYALKFKKGKSTEPFGRLWWDEIINTVVTRAQPHNRTFVHPNQDRVLTVREIARLQGFPDCYQLLGPVKERYKQVGNAVAVPVAIGLGYAFGNAWECFADQSLINLPFKFPNCLAIEKLS